MRKLLNTLYVFTEDMYLTLDGENVVVKVQGKERGRVPLHTLESILSFSYMGASPALMGACVERGIQLSLFNPRGRFLARVEGEAHGSVYTRKAQYRISEDESQALGIARNFIVGKLYNSKWVLQRGLRDHGLVVDSEALRFASDHLTDAMDSAMASETIASLRGIEGDAAAAYYGVFDELILRNKETFRFTGRVRRPPTDPVNAMLSLFYTVLSQDCANALEGVGLDSYIGFLHTDRAGRRSLALDLMEELRPVFVDWFVLTAINNRIVSNRDFAMRETGEVRLGDKARKRLFEVWQERKRDEIQHPFLRERIPWGLVPHVQALLLARYLRGDLDGYPPFLWK